MTKIKALKVKFESWDDFFAKAEIALHDAVVHGKKTIQDKDVRLWSSVEAYQKFMNGQKHAILAAIYKYQPQSVYQLAKILNRAQQNVARDCDVLEGHKFIKFVESKDGRKTKAPRLFFDYNAIVVYMPNLTYRIDFDVTAA